MASSSEAYTLPFWAELIMKDKVKTRKKNCFMMDGLDLIEAKYEAVRANNRGFYAVNKRFIIIKFILAKA
jgi:hypothetical protein